MGKNVAAVVLGATLAVGSASACQLRAGTSLATYLAENRKVQESIVVKLSEQADEIAIARPLSLDPEAGRATFVLERFVKGDRTKRVELRWSTDRIVVGCSASTYYQTINLSLGERYLIYFKDGQLLRAGPAKRTPDELSLREELKLVAPREAPNNSSKPTPLRGAA